MKGTTYLNFLLMIAYLIGIGVGYILKSENTDAIKAIVPIIMGAGFAVYLIPCYWKNKET